MLMPLAFKRKTLIRSKNGRKQRVPAVLSGKRDKGENTVYKADIIKPKNKVTNGRFPLLYVELQSTQYHNVHKNLAGARMSDRFGNSLIN